MAQCVDHNHSSGAVGGNQRCQGRNYKQTNPRCNNEPFRSDQVETQWDSPYLARRAPAEIRMIDGISDNICEHYSCCRAHDAKEAAFSQKLLADSLAANPHGARSTDLTSAFDYTHAHGVYHSEENHDGDNGGNEREDRSEQPNDLVVLRIQFGEVADLEVKGVFLE